MKNRLRRVLCVMLIAALCLCMETPVQAATQSKTYKAAVSSYTKLVKAAKGSYKIVDVDKNGVPELFFHNQKTCRDEVYTYSKGKRVRLLRMDPGMNMMPGASYSGLGYRPYKKSIRIATANTGGVVEKYYTLKGTKLTRTHIFTSSRDSRHNYTFKINGKKVSQTTFLKKLNALRGKYVVVKN